MKMAHSTMTALVLLMGMVLNGRCWAATLPLPMEKQFLNPTGITWLHLGGHPMSRRYEIAPGPKHFCKLEAVKYHCNANPCQGEDSLQIKLSYYDPSMNEDKGVIRNYLDFAWSDVENRNPFEPREPWTSLSSHGKNITEVSYLPEENATVVFQTVKFMFYNYTWAKIITNDAHDEIESIRLSHDSSPETPEEDRWTVLDCQPE